PLGEQGPCPVAVGAGRRGDKEQYHHATSHCRKEQLPYREPLGKRSQYRPGVASPSKLHRQLAAVIRDHLAKRGWEQYRLADYSGIGRSHLSRLLNLQQSPTLTTLEKIAQALDVSVRELLPP